MLNNGQYSPIGQTGFNSNTMNDPSFYQEDDISILLGEDDVNATSSQLIPYFNLTASRNQLPTASGITSMEALRNAYEELKKKYNDLDLSHQRLLTLCRKKQRMTDSILDELSVGSRSLDEKSKVVQVGRKDEIEKLHSAILRLNHELSEEKSKNIKLQVQISSHKEMSQLNFEEEDKNEKSTSILEDLKQNIDMLEKSVEIHKALISKQLPEGKHLDNQPLFGTSDIISHRKQQSEHDELSSLGNKPGYSPKREPLSSSVVSSTKATFSAAAAATEVAQNATAVHKSADVQKGASIVDLKSNKLKQDRHKHKTPTLALPPPYLQTNALPSSPLLPPSSSSSSSPQTASTITTATTTTMFNPCVREKDVLNFNNVQAILPGKTSEQFECSPEMLCPICEEPFTDLSRFQEHVFDCKYDPTLDRNCPICPKNFTGAAQAEFEEHVNAHFDLPADEYEIF